jgi:hypothetical protein
MMLFCPCGKNLSDRVIRSPAAVDIHKFHLWFLLRRKLHDGPASTFCAVRQRLCKEVTLVQQRSRSDRKQQPGRLVCANAKSRRRHDVHRPPAAHNMLPTVLCLGVDSCHRQAEHQHRAAQLGQHGQVLAAGWSVSAARWRRGACGHTKPRTGLQLGGRRRGGLP